MATTTTDDDFHEIQLNGKQLVFLFMAVTVVSVVIFLCGVLVGRGVRGAQPDQQALAATVESGAPPIGDVPAPATTDGGQPTTANETLSYPDRLAGNNPPPEQLRAEVQPPSPEPPTPVAEEPADEPAPATAAGADEAPTRAAAASREPAGAGFAIQVAALAKRAEADAIAQRLGGKGFSAYVVAPAAGAPQVYRVRVGKFKERREAESVAARLAKEEQFKPWIVR